MLCRLLALRFGPWEVIRTQSKTCLVSCRPASEEQRVSTDLQSELQKEGIRWFVADLTSFEIVDPIAFESGLAVALTDWNGVGLAACLRCS